MKNYAKTLEKAYGTEPAWSAESFSSNEERDSALQRAYNWYWKKGTARDHKRWVLDYCKHLKMDATSLKAISHNSIKSYSAIGYLCRMLSRGAPLPKTSKDSVHAELESLKKSGTEALAKRSATNLPSIQERVEMKYKEYLGDIDVFVDKAVDASANKTDVRFDPVGWATSRGIKPIHCGKIASYIEKTYLEEMVEAYSGKDEQLVEGYSYLTKPRFKKLIQLLAETANAIRSFGDQKKSERKPRQKKQKSASQLIKKLKYLIKSEIYNLSSINPEKIVGSNFLVVFNEKYRTLTVYHSLDPRGLSVKGTTITNFDETKSITKKLRNPEDVLNRLSGIRAIQTTMSGIKTKGSPPNGRINENCILVGAY